MAEQGQQQIPNQNVEQPPQVVVQPIPQVAIQNQPPIVVQVVQQNPPVQNIQQPVLQVQVNIQNQPAVQQKIQEVPVVAQVKIAQIQIQVPIQMQKQQSEKFREKKQILLNQLMNQKCIIGGSATHLCSQQCETNAVVCQNLQCQCRRNHQYCALVQLRNFNKAVLSNLRDPRETIYGLDRIFQHMINLISQAREKLFQMLDNNTYGLNKIQMDYMRLCLCQQSSKNSAAIKNGQFIRDILTQKYKLRWTEIKEFINQLSIKVQQNENQILHQYENLKKQIQKSWQREEPYFVSSNIVKLTEENEFLLNSIKQAINPQKIELLFRGSEQNFSTEVFKQKCHSHSNLLVLAKNQNKKIYGGYTPCSYSKDEINVQKTDQSKKSFIFQLTKKVRSRLVNKQNALFISNNQNNLISFGSSQEPNISIPINCHTQKKSIFNPHNSYTQKNIKYPQSKLQELQIYRIY